MKHAILLSLICGASVWAQIAPPMIGYVPDGARIRPMYGMASAGAIGNAMDAGRDFAKIAISPKQDFALATAADTGEMLVVRPGVKFSTIDGTGVNPEKMALSARGTAAVLWFAAVSRLQIVTGLPDAPSVRNVDASFVSGSPVAMAVSDDGQWSAGIWASGATAFGPSGEVIPLQTDAGIVAISFLHNRHDLALANGSRVSLISDVGGSTQPSVIADYSAQPLQAVGLAVSFDNARAVIADAGGSIVTVNLADGSMSSVDCGCAPDGVFGLGGALFRLNGASGELKVFDASAGAVFIVPPALAQNGGQQ